MLYRLMFLLIPCFLFAQPNIAEVKAAVMQNPALLDTPQAKAEMAKRGLNAAEVKQKVLDAKIKDKNADIAIKSSEAENKIDDSTQSSELTQITRKQKRKFHDINPFQYKGEVSFNNQKQKLIDNKLARYSMKFYTNRNSVDAASLPTPDDYIITSGDVFSIQVYGDRNEDYLLTVKNDGTINIAYIGPIKVGGMSFKKAKAYLQKSLKNHYKLSEFNINLSKYSTIQVTLVGDVKHPGLYNLSSFATVKDLLIASQGLESSASVRDIVVKRDSKVIAKIDFYDLLFHGEQNGKVLLKHGDIVIIKKAQKLVSIDGYVKNAAQFELKKGENLDKLIEYAGGMRPDASKTNIKISRYLNNTVKETYNISLNEAKNFKMLDGDKVYIYPLGFNANQSVNIYGNVIRPGSYRLPKAKTLNELLKDASKDGIKSFFLPETYFEYGVIKRYSDSLEYITESFDLMKVLDGSEIVHLKPQDQIFIFNKHDIFSSAYVQTKGKDLLRPGKLQYYEGMSIQDAINASGVTGVLDDKVRVTTYNTKDLMPKTTIYSLKNDNETKLYPYDEIEVFDFYNKNNLTPLSIKGAVLHPSSIYYEKGMSLKKLIDIAGGFTSKAYTKEVEVVRYYVDKNQERQRKILKFNLEKKSMDKIILEPYDEVTIFSIPKWNERKTVKVEGQVKFPGVYTIDNGEKLASVLERAGGFTDTAFVKGAVFTRESIRQNQIEQYNASLARIKRQLAIFNAMPANSKVSVASVQASNTLNEVVEDAKKYQPIGRVSVTIDENLTKFEESPFNLVLQDQDSITIPQQIDTVTVFGEVFNPSSFVYNDANDVDSYIALASGYSRAADTDRVYVIHADGTSEPIDSGWFGSEIDIDKGDTIVVPIYIKEFNQLEIWNSISKVLSNFALTAAAINSLGIAK